MLSLFAGPTPRNLQSSSGNFQQWGNVTVVRNCPVIFCHFRGAPSHRQRIAPCAQSGGTASAGANQRANCDSSGYRMWHGAAGHEGLALTGLVATAVRGCQAAACPRPIGCRARCGPALDPLPSPVRLHERSEWRKQGTITAKPREKTFPVFRHQPVCHVVGVRVRVIR